MVYLRMSVMRARRLYWSFVNLHPSHRPCPTQGFDEAIDALRSYYNGVSASLQSLVRRSRTTSEHMHSGTRCFAPFSKPECEELLNVLHRSRSESLLFY